MPGQLPPLSHPVFNVPPPSCGSHLGDTDASLHCSTPSEQTSPHMLQVLMTCPYHGVARCGLPNKCGRKGLLADACDCAAAVPLGLGGTVHCPAQLLSFGAGRGGLTWGLTWTGGHGSARPRGRNGLPHYPDPRMSLMPLSLCHLALQLATALHLRTCPSVPSRQRTPSTSGAWTRARNGCRSVFLTKKLLASPCGMATVDARG